jgi:hypothetical protein
MPEVYHGSDPCATLEDHPRKETMDKATQFRNRLSAAGYVGLLDDLEDVIEEEFTKGYKAGLGDALAEIKGMLD